MRTRCVLARATGLFMLRRDDLGCLPRHHPPAPRALNPDVEDVDMTRGTLTVLTGGDVQPAFHQRRVAEDLNGGIRKLHRVYAGFAAHDRGDSLGFVLPRVSVRVAVNDSFT